MFAFLGLTVGVITSDSPRAARQAALAADITYLTGEGGGGARESTRGGSSKAGGCLPASYLPRLCAPRMRSFFV